MHGEERVAGGSGKDPREMLKRTLALRRLTNRWRRESNDPSLWMFSSTASVSADDDGGTFMRNPVNAVQLDCSVPGRSAMRCYVTLCLAKRSASCMTRLSWPFVQTQPFCDASF